MKNETGDLIAAFLARGGRVQRVDADERTMTEREMWLARRGNSPRKKTENELIEERHVDGNGVVTNGLGEIIGRV